MDDNKLKNKVGMLSFHESLSYGATLQCYALQKTIRDMGFASEFINFQRKKCAEFHQAQTQPTLKDRVKRLAIKAAVKLQNVRLANNNASVERTFREFKDQYLSVGKEEYCSIRSLYTSDLKYDVYLTGSDQVWNPYNSVLQVYGLGFVPPQINTVSYAASIGVSEIPDEKKATMHQALQGVRHLSCREYEGAKALSTLLGREVTTVLDPTLLLKKDEWRALKAPMELPSKYVLCFFLGSLDYPREVAYKLAKQNGCELLVIPGSPKDVFTKGKIVKGCGPQQFLELFFNAAFVCTDSFHGTAFALNFNKPFFSFCRRGYHEKTSYISRIKDLLETVGLSDRLVYPESETDFAIPKIDFSAANEILERERERSLSYLHSALSDEIKM